MIRDAKRPPIKIRGTETKYQIEGQKREGEIRETCNQKKKKTDRVPKKEVEFRSCKGKDLRAPQGEV